MRALVSVARRTARTPVPCSRRAHSSIPQALSKPSGDSQSASPLPSYGQPLPFTHPHLINPSHLTPGIPATEYDERRRNLVEALPEGSVVVSCGARVQYMSQSIFYKFRQASDFWYLTGWQEPDSAVIIEQDASSSRGYKMTLFVPPNDPDAELWEGARTGLPGAVDIFGADDAYDISLFTAHLRTHLSTPSDAPVFLDVPPNAFPKSPSGSSQGRSMVSQNIFNFLSPSSSLSDPVNLHSPRPKQPSKQSDYDSVMSMLSQGVVWSDLSKKRVKATRSIEPLKPFVERMRVAKSPNEFRIMKEAAEISALGHIQAMKMAQPGKLERQLETVFDYTTQMYGSQRPAYVPVVASGPAALTIHYTSNDRLMQPDSLVLFDAGCEYNGYSADITRTFPVSGSFTSPQKDLYQAVLSVQRECIKLCTASQGLTLNELHRKSCEIFKAELSQVGLQLSKLGLLERVLYPHFISHPLGIDLHDTPSWARNARIEEGMVITIEPGIYVPPHGEYPKHFHNIGIRIEDDIYVDRDHPINLSASAPKEVDDVEACCQRLLE